MDQVKEFTTGVNHQAAVLDLSGLHRPAEILQHQVVLATQAAQTGAQVGSSNNSSGLNNMNNSQCRTTGTNEINQESMREYSRFRENMLRHLAMTKGRRGHHNGGGSGSVMAMLAAAASSGHFRMDEESDGSSQDDVRKGDEVNYFERRKKNNEAAKRSRDSRRVKEDEIAIRAAFLEQENLQLKWEAARLKSETARLRTILLSDAPTFSPTGSLK
jgi:hypothetical protein